MGNKQNGVTWVMAWRFQGVGGNIRAVHMHQQSFSFSFEIYNSLIYK